jgi:small subunit ribosomal protein S21
MLRIKIGKKENINQAIKRLKRKVRNTGLIKQIRENRYFEKPSAVKRKRKQKAVYQKNWEMKNGIDI